MVGCTPFPDLLPATERLLAVGEGCELRLGMQPLVGLPAVSRSDMSKLDVLTLQQPCKCPQLVSSGLRACACCTTVGKQPTEELVQVRTHAHTHTRMASDLHTAYPQMGGSALP